MIPVSEPLLGQKELDNVTDCITTGWISSAGKYITQFEERWASYCGRRYGIAVSNGTTALQVAIKCIDLQPGDEVIVPTFTIISCAMAVIESGGIPVFVDSDPRTWTMDVDQIKEKITPHTKAIMPVHIYGHPVDMDAITNLGNEYGLKIIEDAAEAHGAEYLTKRNTIDSSWKRCGSFGDISCFSFYANKIITTGEGGMLLTDDQDIALKARSYRDLCFQPARRFYHEQLGYNFRLTNMQAAIGVAQTERVQEFIEKKRWMAQEYTKRLSDIKEIQIPIEEVWAKNVYWMYGLIISEKTGFSSKSFASTLRDKGIDTRPFFLGLHEQPVFHNLGMYKTEKYPVSERMSRQGLYLPSGLTITEDQIEQVANAIREILGYG